MQAFFCGVIEGFFGRAWSAQARTAYATFLAEQSFDCYIYAPKSDHYLRRDWYKPWPVATFAAIQEQVNTYHQAGLRFGVGLSPGDLLQRHVDTAYRRQIRTKVREINQWGVDILCILFDDRRGDHPQLAQRQLAIVEEILTVSHADQHIVCPTYYSVDPLLDKVFGQRPSDYLSQLGRELPPAMGVFWTGDQVISPSITHSSIEKITDLIGRKPVLWDNELANDGKQRADYLMLRPITGRSYTLKNQVQGHIVNPMSQAFLAQLPLLTVRACYTKADAYCPTTAWQQALDTLALPVLRDLLARDSACFSEQGLIGLNDQKRQALLSDYTAIDHPMAQEVCDWLQGHYRFDPACLTE